MAKRARWVGLVLVLVGAWAAFDLLVTSDREQVEAIAGAFRGEVSNARLQAALAHVDVDVQPLETRVRGTTRVYGRGAAGDLARDARRRLAPLSGARFRPLQERIEVDGDDAEVQMRLVSEAGTGTLRLRLRKHDARWLLRALEVQR
ncbi:MAG: hypothetical protein AAF447_08630 [Myxococcota bacterium]